MALPTTAQTGENDNVGTDIETILGGSGNDVIVGSANVVAGLQWTFQTYLSGGPGDDSIYGSPGNDRIDGGDGNDLTFGGALALIPSPAVTETTRFAADPVVTRSTAARETTRSTTPVSPRR